jgi:hypothetical protein
VITGGLDDMPDPAADIIKRFETIPYTTLGLSNARVQQSPDRESGLFIFLPVVLSIPSESL